MSLNAKKAGGTGGSKKTQQPIMEAGGYPVRVVQIVDLGIQPQRPYKGEEKPPVHMIHLTYEFVDVFMLDEDGNEQEDKPRWLSESMPLYNLKSEKAKSTQRYKALDPKEVHEGDFTELLGAPATAMVSTYQLKNGPNAGQERNKIESLTAMRPRDAAKTPELVNQPKVFVLDEPDMEVFQTFPEWLQDVIKGNLEYNGSELQRLVEGGGEAKKEEPKQAPSGSSETGDAQDGMPEDDTDDEENPW